MLGLVDINLEQIPYTMIPIRKGARNNYHLQGEGEKIPT